MNLEKYISAPASFKRTFVFADLQTEVFSLPNHFFGNRK